MATKIARGQSAASSLSRSRSPISDNENRSAFISTRRGPSTPDQASTLQDNSDEEQQSNAGQLSTLRDVDKEILDNASSKAMSDTDEDEEKKRAHHRHHSRHRHHKKPTKLKSNKRSATEQRHSLKRRKKETNSSSRHKKSDGENSRSSSEKQSSESEAPKSDQPVSSSNHGTAEEEEEEEGLIEGGNTTPKERRSRRHHKKRVSSSNREKRSSSSNSSLISSEKSIKGTQLIVNYLPSSLRESDFYQLFARVAPVKLCKLITDRHTGHSYCYGFVEYHTKDDAMKAIEKYNGYKIENKKLKVSYAQPKSNSQLNDDISNDRCLSSTSKNPNIYVTELPDSFDEKMLERLFSKYGEIVKTKILRDPRTRISRGVGFVLMTSTRYAERAIKALDGYIPSGSRIPISVKYADPNKTAMGSSGRNSSSSRLSHVSPLQPPIGPYGYSPGAASFGMIDPYYRAAPLHHHHRRGSMNSRDLSPSPPLHLSSYYSTSGGSSRSYNSHNVGSSSSSRIRGSSPGLPRSYSSGSAKHDSSLNTSGIGNVTNPNALSAAYELIAKGFQQAIDPNGFVIYAFGLPHDCTESELEELFRRHGDVYRVYIVRNYATGESKGYSFVTMRNYDEACHAVSRLDGSSFQGRTIQVRFKQ